MAVVEGGSFVELDNGNISQIPSDDSQYSGSDPSQIQPLIDWGIITEPQPVTLNPKRLDERGVGCRSVANRIVFRESADASYSILKESVLGAGTTKLHSVDDSANRDDDKVLLETISILIGTNIAALSLCNPVFEGAEFWPIAQTNRRLARQVGHCRRWSELHVQKHSAILQEECQVHASKWSKTLSRNYSRHLCRLWCISLQPHRRTTWRVLCQLLPTFFAIHPISLPKARSERDRGAQQRKASWLVGDDLYSRP